MHELLEELTINLLFNNFFSKLGGTQFLVRGVTSSTSSSTSAHGGSSTEGFPQFSPLFIFFRKFTLYKYKLLTRAPSSSPENILYHNVKCAGHRYQSKSIHLHITSVDFWLFWTCCETLISVLDVCIKSERRQRITDSPS